MTSRPPRSTTRSRSRALPGGKLRIGIHIAAPALGIAPGSALDAAARERLSTVYFPGSKITMLPEAAIEAYSLAEGSACPALSLYLEVAPDLSIVSQTTRIERVPGRRTTCGTTRWSRRSTRRRSPRAASTTPTRTRSRLCGASRARWKRRGAAARPSTRRGPSTTSTSRTTACASCSGCAARRSTRSSRSS